MKDGAPESPAHQRDQEFDDTRRLVEASQAGDRTALEKLFARYLPRVRQIVAFRMGYSLRQFSDLDDLVQEALLKILKGLERFRFQERSEGAFRNWVSKCVECEIVDQARSRKARKRDACNVRRFADFDSAALHSSILAGSEPSPSEVAQAKELGEKIEECLASLPDHYRDLIILRNVCSMTYAEIAAEMGFGQEGVARVAFSRALQKLRETLEK
jgi:RNA polymerase sigma-70 factor (ECF subfamily)